jgi:UDP-glucose 4-epimerase
MRKVIVTGGCGYIGSHVARAFKQNGDQVFVIDRVLREHCLKGIDYFKIGDYADPPMLSEIRKWGPDIVVHCAGTSLVGPSMTNPADYYDNNVAKTVKLLNYVISFGKTPLIMFSSSAAVYGEPSAVPCNENSKIDPVSPYGNTKAIIETILKDYDLAYNVPSVIFRYFNAAGAEPYHFDLGQEPGATHIIARALEASIGNTEFILNGTGFNTVDGTCIRDYIHVWDIARAHVIAADFKLEDYPQPGVDIFNLGTNKGFSNQQIIDYVSDHYGLSNITIGEPRAGDPAELVADATQAKDILRWIPTHSDLKTIIDSAYKWYTGRPADTVAV